MYSSSASSSSPDLAANNPSQSYNLAPRARQLNRSFVMAALLICLLIDGFFGFLLRNFAVDDAYITFRHALNLSNGEGFTFNPGERLLSTTSPLHGLVLSLLATLGLRNSIPQTAIWLSVISMVALCIALLLCFEQANMPLAGCICILLVVSQHWLYQFFSLETILVIALNVTTVALALRKHWFWAGVIGAIAMVGRPDSILVAVIVGIYCVSTTRKSVPQLFRFALPLVLIYGSWLLFSLLYFGHLFPNTLEAKSGFATWTVFIDALWPKMISTLTPLYKPASVLILFFAVIGLIDLLYHRSSLLIFPIWALLQTIGYTLLRIPYPFAWYYAPIILVALMLAAVGGTVLILHAQKWAISTPVLSRILGVGTLLLFVGLVLLSLQSTWSFISTYDSLYYGGARDHVYQQVGRWLAANGRPGSTVALTDVGTIGYFSHLRIIDFAGLVTYELRDLPKHGSYSETIAAIRPDYIVSVRGLPPDPQLIGLDGYTSIQRFPKGGENQFEDIVIYQANNLLPDK